MGYIFYFVALFFPFIVTYLLHSKTQHLHRPKQYDNYFDSMYACLYEDYKT